MNLDMAVIKDFSAKVGILSSCRGVKGQSKKASIEACDTIEKLNANSIN